MKRAGQFFIVPAHVFHKFKNQGNERLSQFDIYAKQSVTHWLECRSGFGAGLVHLGAHRGLAALRVGGWTMGNSKPEMTVREYSFTTGEAHDLSKAGLEQCLDKIAAGFGKAWAADHRIVK